MKKSVLILSLFLSLFIQKSLAQTATLENVVANPGEDVLVSLDFTGMFNLGAITLYITFDTAVATFNGITNISDQGQGTIAYLPPNSNVIGIGWTANNSGVDFPDGKYLDIQFTMIGGYTGLNFTQDCEIATYDWTILNVDFIDGSLSSPAANFNLKVFLQGAYQTGTGGTMRTDLLNNNIIPDNQPFGPALPYFGNNSPAWYYSGNENTASIPPGTVDWILVELRDAATASEATAASVVAQKACFLLSDGSVVDKNGNNPVFYTSFTEGAFVVIWHRNHLGIMSSTPVPGLGNSYSYNFTIGSATVAGGETGYVELENGVWGMAAGDINADKIIDISDKNEGWKTEAGISGYSGADINLDTQSDNPDKNEFLISNIGKISGVPD